MLTWLKKWMAGGEAPEMPPAWELAADEEWFFDSELWKWVARRKATASDDGECELEGCDVSEAISTVAGSLFDPGNEGPGNGCCGGTCHAAAPETVYAPEPVQATVPAHSPAAYDYTPPASSHHWSGSGSSHSHDSGSSHSHDSGSSSSYGSPSCDSSSSSDSGGCSSDGGGGGGGD